MRDWLARRKGSGEGEGGGEGLGGTLATQASYHLDTQKHCSECHTEQSPGQMSHATEKHTRGRMEHGVHMDSGNGGLRGSLLGNRSSAGREATKGTVLSHREHTDSRLELSPSTTALIGPQVILQLARI